MQRKWRINKNKKWSISWYVKWDTNASMAGWKICIDTNKNSTCEENKEPFQITDNKWYYKKRLWKINLKKS